MIIVIYGLGKRYRDNKKIIEELFKNDEVVLSDKNYEELALGFEKVVIAPNDIAKNEYSYVVVTVADYESTKNELIGLGIFADRIISLNGVIKMKNQGKLIKYPVKIEDTFPKKVLVITGSLGFHGGAMACASLGEVLKKQKYAVDVACGDANPNIIRWFNERGIGVIIFQSFPHIGGDDSTTIRKYDMVIANTIPAMRAACFASKIVPTIWWIHEAMDFEEGGIYAKAKSDFKLINDIEWLNRLNVIAVSERASEAFSNCFGRKLNVIPIGMTDQQTKGCLHKKTIKIATIGYIREDKNQLTFVQAADSIENDDVKYYMIGNVLCSKDYCEEIEKIVVNNQKIELINEVSKDVLTSMYKDIDIIVCPSYIESLSMTIVEGMMQSKICITTDGTGISDYMEDGVNGFICKSGDVDSLREKMQYAIDHFNDLDYMRENARKTYEKYFTLEILGDNFERVINETIEEFNSRQDK